MAAGEGFAAYEGGRLVETGVIPQWAFPGAHPASLKIRAFRRRLLALNVPADPLSQRNYREMLAYCDQQIAMIENSPSRGWAGVGNPLERETGRTRRPVDTSVKAGV